MSIRTVGLAFLASALMVSGCEEGSYQDGGEGQVAGNILDPVVSDISLTLTPAQLDWVGQKIFRNECAGHHECLVHWNESEAFPSLGIGHFIWYPAGVDEPFVESFPALYEYMEQRQRTIPQWLRELEPFDAPWPDRKTFLKVADSPQVAELREFLAGSQGVQAEFIFRRAKDALAGIVAAAPEHRQAHVKQYIQALSQTPGGVYAIVDYVNFKGEGLSPEERYNGEGWGLLQVLLAMPAITGGDDAGASGKESAGPAPDVLAEFRNAAGEVLTRRARNAASPVERDRWLTGWLKRIDTYREPVDMQTVPGVSGE